MEDLQRLHLPENLAFTVNLLKDCRKSEAMTTGEEIINHMGSDLSRTSALLVRSECFSETIALVGEALRTIKYSNNVLWVGKPHVRVA